MQIKEFFTEVLRISIWNVDSSQIIMLVLRGKEKGLQRVMMHRVVIRRVQF